MDFAEDGNKNGNGNGNRNDESQDQASLLTPLGSNSKCGNDKNTQRFRREWSHLDDYDRALYLDAVETAVERGLHQRFTAFHYDEVSEIQAHDTCGFYLWHRIFILAYENMLRSLEPRFACLTLPFWDIYRDYEKQESSTNPCRSYATCAKVINDLGGLVKNDDFYERTFFGRKVDGLWHFKPPLQNLRDDDNRVGIIRYDLWYDPIPEEVGVLSVENITRVFGMADHVAFWEILHHGIHDSIHDTIGGFMRTNASPIDPLFMPWHSTMELFDYIWEACHSTAENPIPISNSTDVVAECLYSRHAREHFSNFSLATDEAYMKLNNETDIRDDPQIGAYFAHAMNFSDLWTIRDLDEHHRFRYAGIPENFVKALANNTQACPNGLGSILPLSEEASGKDDNETLGLFNERQPPTFSDQQLEIFKQDWVIEAESYYSSDFNMTVANDSLNLQQKGQQKVSTNKMNFVRCILFEAMDRDTIERWAIDEDAFLSQVVINNRYNNHPLCRDHLSDISSMPDANNPSTTESNTTTNVFLDPTINATKENSCGYYSGRQCTSPWFLTVLLIWLVSKFTQ